VFENATDLRAPEDAQRAFADLYDGDYLMSDLMKRSPAIMLAVMSLYHEMQGPPPAPRSTQFRAQSGETTDISRSTKRPPRMGSVQANTIQVWVRNGRVEGFGKG
jgi:hypothetical protein